MQAKEGDSQGECWASPWVTLPLACSSDDSKSSSPEPVTHLKWDDPYYDIARHQILEVVGDDKYGRKIIVFSACRMPP